MCSVGLMYRRCVGWFKEGRQMTRGKIGRMAGICAFTLLAVVVAAGPAHAGFEIGGATDAQTGSGGLTLSVGRHGLSVGATDATLSSIMLW